MKNLLALIIGLSILVGCDSRQQATLLERVKEVPVDNTPPVSVKSDQKFEGLYYFEDVESNEISGPLEIVVNYEGKITAKQTSNQSKLRSQNFNGSFGTHPRINFSNISVHGPYEESFSYSADVTYASTDDLEKDGSSSDLGSGKKYTVYEFKLLSSGKLQLVIKIHENSSTDNGGINDVVIERKFREVN